MEERRAWEIIVTHQQTLAAFGEENSFEALQLQKGVLPGELQTSLREGCLFLFLFFFCSLCLKQITSYGGSKSKKRVWEGHGGDCRLGFWINPGWPLP